MTTSSLSDLRKIFFGGGSAAEYAFLQSAQAAGVTATDLLGGKMLDSSSSNTVQAGLAAVTPITGLVNDFTVKAGKTVLTALWLPWVQGTVATDTVTGKITDGADVQVQQSPKSLGAGGFTQLLVFEFLAVPGNYTRKGAIQRGAGTGTFTVGAGGVTATALLLSMEF